MAAFAPAQETELAPGMLVAERYRVSKVLGEGGMGAVYLAEHVHMRKEYAIKVLHADVSDAAEMTARFEREAIAAAHIEHPNVAAATDFGRLPSGAFFLVLEYISGQSLRAALEPGAFEPLRALRVVRGVLAGVGAAHAKGIVHRDLKPENVMLVDKDGDPDFVKVLDFGIAKVDAESALGARSASGAKPLTRMGAVFGTPDYMAPEQALGETVDHRADLYAIGVILFELLAGERPFAGGAVTVLSQRVVRDAPPLPDTLAGKVDPRVHAIVQKLLAKTPSARYASAAEVLAAIDEVLTGVSRAPAPPSPVVIVQDAATGHAAYLPTAQAPAVSAAPVVMPSSRVATAPRRGAVVFVAASALVVGVAMAIGVASGSGADGARVGTAPIARAGFAFQGETREAEHVAAAPVSVTAQPVSGAAQPASGAVGGAALGSGTQHGGGTKGGGRGGGGGIHIPPPRTWFHH